MPSRKIGNYGKPWRIRRSRKPIKDDEGILVWGYADFAYREIVLAPDLKDHPLERDVVIHEMIHKKCPFLSEECVEDIGTDVDDVLDLLEL